MGKISKFDKLNEWIKAEYDKKTEEIENSLSDDGSFDPDRIDSDELFRRIQARIRENEKRNVENTGMRKKIFWLNRYRVRKYAAFLVVAIIATFLASMTSEANRSYLEYKVRYLVGSEITLDEGNEDNSSNINLEEEKRQIEQEIENALDIRVPSLEYNLTINSYDIQYGDAVATIEYQYKENIVNFRMYNKNKTDIKGIDFQGKIIQNLTLRVDAINAVVLEINDPGDEEVTLAAQWEYQNGYYQLSGKVQEEDFLKILKTIFY